MKLNTLSRLVFLLALGCFILVPVSQIFAGEPKYGGTLRFGVRNPQYKDLDPRYPNVDTGRPAFPIIYDLLYEWGKDGSKTLEPALATKIESEDNAIWTIHLRKGVKFHNGREMTAEDVKANFDWKINPPKGWRPPLHRSYIQNIQEVQVVDKYTVKVIFGQPFTPFIRLLSRYLRGIAPPEEVEKWGEQFTAHPCGTGPFKVTEIKPKEKVVMERFEGYWGPKPYLDKLEFKYYQSDDARLIALQKGEIDMAQLFDEHRPILDKDPNLEYQIATNSPLVFTLWFNMRRWPMNDLRFRKAVRVGADWENIAPNCYPFKSAQYANTFLTYSSLYNPEAEKLVSPYNPEEAKKLIQAVEKDAGKKIPPVHWLDSSWSPGQILAQSAKAQLAQAGIPLDIKPLSHGIYYNKILRDPKMEWDICILPVGYTRAASIGYRYFESNSGITPDGKSLGGYSNPEFDNWLHKAETASNEGEVTKYYQEAEKVLIKDVAGIPLFPFRMITAYNKKVKGVIINDNAIPYFTRPWCNFWIDE